MIKKIRVEYVHNSFPDKIHVFEKEFTQNGQKGAKKMLNSLLKGRWGNVTIRVINFKVYE